MYITDFKGTLVFPTWPSINNLQDYLLFLENKDKKQKVRYNCKYLPTLPVTGQSDQGVPVS